jgi:hypothetical protein
VNENWVLLALTLTAGAYKTTIAVLAHRRARDAASRKAAKEQSSA